MPNPTPITRPDIPGLKFGKINVAEALDLRIKNKLSYQQIATHLSNKNMSVTKQGVHEALRPYLDGLDVDNCFGRYKDLAMEAKQSKLMSALDDDKIKSMSGSQMLIGVGILEDKIRDIRGQSKQTQSIDIIISMAADSTYKRVTGVGTKDTKSPKPQLPPVPEVIDV